MTVRLWRVCGGLGLAIRLMDLLTGGFQPSNAATRAQPSHAVFLACPSRLNRCAVLESPDQCSVLVHAAAFQRCVMGSVQGL